MNTKKDKEREGEREREREREMPHLEHHIILAAVPQRDDVDEVEVAFEPLKVELLARTEMQTRFPIIYELLKPREICWICGVCSLYL